MKRVLVVAGTRPNFVKVAPLVAQLDARRVDRVLVHTGQHYDAEMSDAFFDDLGIPAPDRNLGIGSGSHAWQTARIMEAFEPVLSHYRPDWVVVVGDVNSTLACALVTSKLRAAMGCGLAHVEAGLRSRDWTMPEEVNRVLTDRLSDLLFTTSREAHANLAREGIEPERIVFAGNVMVDTLLRMLPRARQLGAPARVGVTSGAFLLCTLHRPSNVDDPAALGTILRALQALAADMEVVVPLHPRTRQRVSEFGLDALLQPLRVTKPLGYALMLGLQAEAAAVLTDSGGLQEETTVLGVPCLTLRYTTERPITVTEGTNRLAPWPLTEASLLDAARDAIARGQVGVGTHAPEGWDGHASERIIEALGARAVAKPGQARAP